MKSHYTQTISISVTCILLCLFVTYVSPHSVIRQITDDSNTNLQQEEGAEPNPNLEEELHYLQKHQEISSRDYNKLSSSNTVKGLRDRRPTTYSLKIESFNTLLNSTEKYETRPFSAGGYNWTLLMYPNGNKKDTGSGYISVYVAIDKLSLAASAHQEVYADLRFYIFNKNERKYFTIQDTDVWRFDAFNKMWGFSQVLPVDTFKDPINGYLYGGDHCEFGVDVTVPTPFEKSELFSVSKSSETFTWTVRGFSTLLKDSYYSDLFSLGGRKWQLQMFPSGRGTGSGKAVSLFLILTGGQRTGDYELVYALTKLRVLNQRKLSNLERKLENWFGKEFAWGYSEFISFDDLKDSSKGFLVNDTLMLQVELEAISTTKYFSS